MPTASIHYRTTDPRSPHFILLDGVDASLDPQFGEETTMDSVRRALAGMTAAGHTGWRPAGDNPRIVRQADGRGTIAVEPIPAAAPEPFAEATVYINTSPTDAPHRIAVDGRTLSFDSIYRLADGVADGRHLGVAVIDRHLRSLGYLRTGPVTKDPQSSGSRGNLWTCTAVADETPTVTVHVDPDHRPVMVMVGTRSVEIGDRVRAGSLARGNGEQQGAAALVDAALDAIGYTLAEPLIYNEHLRVYRAPVGPVREWRDEPTLVRITDDTARALTSLSATLGIPGDTLADRLLLRAIRKSKSTHARWSEEGYIEDHSRITGWDAQGFPHLKD